jgi:hypothetical protein
MKFFGSKYAVPQNDKDNNLIASTTFQKYQLSIKNNLIASSTDTQNENYINILRIHTIRLRQFQRYHNHNIRHV